METKRELNDILINDDDLQKQNRTKKLMMMIGMAIVFLCILIAVAFIITRDDEELGEKITAANNGLTPIESTSSQDSQNGDFVTLPIDENANSNDRFQQILDDIRNRDPKNQTPQETTQPTPSTPPLTTPTQTQPKPQANPTQPTTQNQPVLPNNTANTKKPEPAKPAQTTSNTTNTNVAKKPEPAKPTQPAKKPDPAPQAPAQKPEQTASSSIANAFEGVATPPMDLSKNGQVAEKGFYVQVGSFANKPSAEFLKKISNYSYRVYEGRSSNGQQTTRYLIGPYNSRTEASRDLPNFKTLVADPVHFEVK